MSVLDVILIIVLLVYTLTGYRLGLIRSIGGLAGVIAGIVAAVLLSPAIGSLVQNDSGRVVATIVAAIVLVLLGHAIGAGIGAAIGGVLRRSPLGIVDRVLGAVANLVVSALAITTLASFAVQLGVPYVAQPVASSTVLRGIEAVTPQPVAAGLAQLRSLVLSSGIPQLGLALGGAASGTVPSTPSTAALTTAARSVVKITGRAPACSQEQSGSGFVVARDRVLTNAHVVAGVTDPVVLTPGGQALVGRVVAFDRTSDLALLAVRGLAAPTLTVGSTPDIGSTAVVDGYPYGGPFSSGGARVLQTGSTRVPNAVGGGTSIRSIATIAADVEPGNSGGPLLDTAGHVVGIVIAKSTDRADLGYAMTPPEFAQTVDTAAERTATVSTGSCVGD